MQQTPFWIFMVAIGIHIEFTYKTTQDVYALPFNNMHVLCK